MTLADLFGRLASLRYFTLRQWRPGRAHLSIWDGRGVQVLVRQGKAESLESLVQRGLAVLCKRQLGGMPKPKPRTKKDRRCRVCGMSSNLLPFGEVYLCSWHNVNRLADVRRPAPAMPDDDDGDIELE